MRRLTLVLLTVFETSSCTLPQVGTPVGTFQIQGPLVMNACAPGFTVPDSLSYTVDLRRNAGTTLYYRVGAGPFIEGILQPDMSFRVTNRSVRQVIAPNPAMGIRGCNLVQTDVLQGQLSYVANADAATDGTDGGGGFDSGDSSDSESADVAVADAAVSDTGMPDAAASDAGPAVNRMTATEEVTLTAEAGSDCSRVLMSMGGNFPALPCAFSYRFTGMSR